MPSSVCLVVIGNHVKKPDVIKRMENHAMFSSLQQTPFFPYETDKIQGNGHLKISASVSESAFECNYSHLNGINRL